MYENLTYNFIVSKQIPFIVHGAVDILQKQHKHSLLSLYYSIKHSVFMAIDPGGFSAKGGNDASNDTKQKKRHSGGLSGDSAGC